MSKLVKILGNIAFIVILLILLILAKVLPYYPKTVKEFIMLIIMGIPIIIFAGLFEWGLHKYTEYLNKELPQKQVSVFKIIYLLIPVVIVCGIVLFITSFFINKYN